MAIITCPPFPAPAGMNRRYAHGYHHLPTVPRARGDEPART